MHDQELDSIHRPPVRLRARMVEKGQQPPWLLVFSAWTAWGLSVVVPSVFAGVLLLLWPLAGLFPPGLYILGLLTAGVSGCLNLTACVCFVVSFARRESSTYVVAAVSLSCFLVFEVVVLTWLGVAVREFVGT